MKRAAVVASMVVVLFLCGCCATIVLGLSPLGPVTGRWEGTATYNLGPGARDYPIVLVLVQVEEGGVTGALFVEGLPGSGGGSDRTLAVLGEVTGTTVVLRVTDAGSSLVFHGTVSNNTISGETEFRDEVHSWEVTRVE